VQITASAAVTMGDIDNDGDIDVQDAYTVQVEFANISAGKSASFTDEQNAAADINEDGTINVRDAYYIQMYFSKTAAGLNPTWESVLSPTPTPNGTLDDDGDTLSILCWTDTDLNALLKVTSVKNAKYVQVGSDSTEASEMYITYFSSGEDVDLYFCDADWTMAYVNNNNYSAPMSALGIDKSFYLDAYDYTLEIGTADNGVLKGVTYQVASGAYVYRADLAKEYLGVTSPDEMQEYVCDWNTFWNTAKTVYSASNGVTAMADTVAGVLRAYNCDRTTPWVTNGTLSYDSTLYSTISTIYKAYSNGYICNDIEPWTIDWYAIGYATGSLANNTMGYFFPSWSINSSTSQLAAAEGYNSWTDSFNDVGTYGEYAVTKGPTGWYWGGTWICVSPLCDNASDAAQFLYNVTINPDTMKTYALNSGDFVNNQTVMQEIIDKGCNSNSLLYNGQDQFEALSESAASIDYDGIPTEYDGTILTDLTNAVTSYCQGNVNNITECLNYFLDSVAIDLPDITIE